MYSPVNFHEIRASANEWLFRDALPLWADRGVDRKYGGFHDALDSRTIKNAANFKRLRVTTRQIYVFSMAAQKGFSGAEDIVRHGLEFMNGPLLCKSGGYYSRCSIQGEIIDHDQDLYDLAFSLFSLAAAYKVLKSEDLRQQARALAYYLHDNFRHPAGGFIESSSARLPRRQNPHMHLFEASLAATDIFGDKIFADLALELFDLYKTKFLSVDGHFINEYFNDDWSMDLSNGAGYGVVEPGHHMEWLWLISEFNRLFDLRSEVATNAARFAFESGYNRKSGFLTAEMLTDGTVKDASVRLWPHCEWLRAAAISELNGNNSLRLDLAWHSLSRFLEAPVRGLWHERWSSKEGAFENTSTPASSLYHLVGAISALQNDEG